MVLTSLWNRVWLRVWHVLYLVDVGSGMKIQQHSAPRGFNAVRCEMVLLP